MNTTNRPPVVKNIYTDRVNNLHQALISSCKCWARKYSDISVGIS